MEPPLFFIRENPSLADTILARQLEIDGKPIANESRQSDADLIFDRNWLKIAFMVPDSDIESDIDIKNRYYTSASAIC